MVWWGLVWTITVPDIWKHYVWKPPEREVRESVAVVNILLIRNLAFIENLLFVFCDPSCRWCEVGIPATATDPDISLYIKQNTEQVVRTSFCLGCRRRLFYYWMAIRFTASVKFPHDGNFCILLGKPLATKWKLLIVLLIITQYDHKVINVNVI